MSHVSPDNTQRVTPTSVVPLHVITNRIVLMPEGHWSVQALEAIVGEPATYVSSTVRLFIVLPEVSVTRLNVRELAELLTPYAISHDLKVELECLMGGILHRPRKVINDQARSTHQLSIVIIGKEECTFLSETGDDAAEAIFREMKLSPSLDYFVQRNNVADGWHFLRTDFLFDVAALASNCSKTTNSTEHDYTVLVHHHTDPSGRYVREEYPIRAYL